MGVSNGEAMVVDHPMVVDIDLQGHPMVAIDLQGHPMVPMVDMVEKRETPNLKLWLLLSLRKLILRVSNGEAMVVDILKDIKGHPMVAIDLQDHPMDPMVDMVEKRETLNLKLWLLLNLRKLILRVSNGGAMVVDHPMVVAIDLQDHLVMSVSIDLQDHPMVDMVEKRETPNLKPHYQLDLSIQCLYKRTATWMKDYLKKKRKDLPGLIPSVVSVEDVVNALEDNITVEDMGHFSLTLDMDDRPLMDKDKYLQK